MLGRQQDPKNARRALDVQRQEIAELQREYDKLKGDAFNNSPGSIASRAWGHVPGISTGAEQDTKRARELQGEIKKLQDDMDADIDKLENEETSLRKLRARFGMTTKQILQFATEHDIDMLGPSKRTVKRFSEVWEEFGKDWQKTKDETEDPLTPQVDPAEIEDLQAKIDGVQNQWNTMRSTMQKVVDGWKQAALEAFDKWAEKQVEGIDKQIKAIQDLTKAEDQALRRREYLRRREELALRRREMQTRYQADRDLAIFEGRYDDAAMLDMEHERDVKDLDRDERDLEEDHQREMTRIQRDAKIERLNSLKDEKQKQLSLQKEALQNQLDEITKFTPKNAAAAAEMQRQILGAMGSYTGRYGTLAATQHRLWKKTWRGAWEETKEIVADDAWWAGRGAASEFAKALGVKLAPTKKKKSAPDKDAFVPGTGLTGTQHSEVIAIYHKGGKTGDPAGSPQDVPAVLQTGEYVVQRKAVAKYGTDYLNALNQGQVYHAGGPVDMQGAARAGLRKATKKYTSDFFNKGAELAGMKWEHVKNLYRNAVSGDSGGSADTAGKSIAEIVDTVVKGIHPTLKSRYEAWNKEMGGKFRIGSSYRSMAQQAALYRDWLAGVPGQAQAAPPGKSMHNFGLAIDLVPSRTTSAERAAGAKYGLRWPMGFEPWHVEPNEAKAWRAKILNGIMPGAASLPTGGLTLRDGFFQGIPGTSTSTGTSASTLAIKAIVKGMLSRFGWGLDQWPSLESLVQGESSWNPNAANPTTSARGLFQKMTSIHGPIESTIEGQANWGLNYIKGRYGSPSAAYSRWLGRNPHWYHYGGLAQLKNGGTTLNDGIAKLHKSETVLTAPLSQELVDGIRNMGGNTTIELKIGNFLGSDREIEKLGRELERVMTKVQRAKGNQPRTFSSN
jgi:uncharacterized protein YukE